MAVMGSVILGLAAGAIAKTMHRGAKAGDVLGTLAAGFVGSLLGGFLTSAIGIGTIRSVFNPGTSLIAIGGAPLLPVINNAVAGRSGGRTLQAAR